MEPNDLTLLRRLLTGEKLLTLAVVVDGAPIAGVLPFRAEADLASLLVHTSTLARHSRGLTPGAPFSAAAWLLVAVPTMADSASGVSSTRSSPNSACSPSVTRNTPPRVPMSSPISSTR